MYVIYKGHNLELQAEPWEAQETLLGEERMPIQNAQKEIGNEESHGVIYYHRLLRECCIHVCSSISRTLSLILEGYFRNTFIKAYGARASTAMNSCMCGFSSSPVGWFSFSCLYFFV